MPQQISFSSGSSAKNKMFQICRKFNFHLPYAHREEGAVEISFKFPNCPDIETGFSLLLRMLDRSADHSDATDYKDESYTHGKTDPTHVSQIKSEFIDDNEKSDTKPATENLTSTPVTPKSSPLHGRLRPTKPVDDICQEMSLMKMSSTESSSRIDRPPNFSSNTKDRSTKHISAESTSTPSEMSDYQPSMDASIVHDNRGDRRQAYDSGALTGSDHSFEVSDDEILSQFRQQFALSDRPERYKQPFISYLNEYAQKIRQPPPDYEITERFQCSCSYGAIVGHANGISKKNAKSNAALQVMRQLLSLNITEKPNIISNASTSQAASAIRSSGLANMNTGSVVEEAATTAMVATVNEYFQKKGWVTPVYTVTEVRNQQFQCSAVFREIAGKTTEVAGPYGSKKLAKSHCAKKIKTLIDQIEY